MSVRQDLPSLLAGLPLTTSKNGPPLDPLPDTRRLQLYLQKAKAYKSKEHSKNLFGFQPSDASTTTQSRTNLDVTAQFGTIKKMLAVPLILKNQSDKYTQKRVIPMVRNLSQHPCPSHKISKVNNFFQQLKNKRETVKDNTKQGGSRTNRERLRTEGDRLETEGDRLETEGEQQIQQDKMNSKDCGQSIIEEGMNRRQQTQTTPISGRLSRGHSSHLITSQQKVVQKIFRGDLKASLRWEDTQQNRFRIRKKHQQSLNNIIY